MGLVTKIGNADQICGEVTIEWKIADFFPLWSEVDDSYHSPIFIFAKSQWYLKLHCMDLRSETSSSQYLVLYLMRKDNGPLKTMYYTLGIDGGEVKEFEYHFSRENKGYLCPSFCCKIELFPKEDPSQTEDPSPTEDLIVTCVLRNNDSSTVIETKLQKSLLSMLESEEDSDVLIKVQGKEYSAHRCILRMRSPVFKSMFSHGMMEKQSGVVTIEDCDPDTFYDFLVHMYTGSCQHISSENVFSLYQAADKYDVSDLKVGCINFMKRNLTIACIYDIIMFAAKYDEAELMKYATKYFSENSLTIIKTAEWKAFSEENWTVGNELIVKTLSQQVSPDLVENWKVESMDFKELSLQVPFLPGRLHFNFTSLVGFLLMICSLIFFFV